MVASDFGLRPGLAVCVEMPLTVLFEILSQPLSV